MLASAYGGFASTVSDYRGLVQLSSATLTLTINSLEVVLGRLADVLIFHSSVTPLAVLGTVMSFVGAVTVTLGGKKSES